MSKHTPGPWTVLPSAHGGMYNSVQIGTDEMYNILEVEPADARLIAAAPDMLDALKALADMAQTNVTDLGAIIQEGGEWTAEDRADLKRWGRVLEAIAKAEGAK